MYEVLIAGGPSDGRIIGEFKDLFDAYDDLLLIKIEVKIFGIFRRKFN
mgnify:CR=1 FL=1